MMDGNTKIPPTSARNVKVALPARTIPRAALPARKVLVKVVNLVFTRPKMIQVTNIFYDIKYLTVTNISSLYFSLSLSLSLSLSFDIRQCRHSFRIWSSVYRLQRLSRGDVPFLYGRVPFAAKY